MAIPKKKVHPTRADVINEPLIAWISAFLTHALYLHSQNDWNIKPALCSYLLFSFSSPPKAKMVLIEDKTSVATELAFKYFASVFSLVLFDACMVYLHV